MKRRQVCAPSQTRPVGLGRRAPPTYRQRREWSATMKKIHEEFAFHNHLSPRAKVGRPRRVSPTALPPYRPTSSLQKSKFNKHRSTILPLSRRWRQVGGPRRVGPTACPIKIYEEPQIIKPAPAPSRPRSRAMGHGHASMPPRSIPHWPLLLTPDAHRPTT